MKKRLSVLVLATCLTAACVLPNWVSQAETIAEESIPIVAGIAAIVSPGAAPLITRISAGLSVLFGQLDAYKKNQSAATLAQIQAQLAALNADLQSLNAAGNIQDPKSQQEVQQILTLLIQEFQGIAANAGPPTKGIAGVKRRAVLPISEKDFRSRYNSIVAGDSRFIPLK